MPGANQQNRSVQRIQRIQEKQMVQTQEDDWMRDDAVDGEELIGASGATSPSQTHCKTDRRTRVDGTRIVQKLVSPLHSVKSNSC